MSPNGRRQEAAGRRVAGKASRSTVLRQGRRDTDRQARPCGLQAIIQSVGQAGQSAHCDATHTHTHTL